MRAVLFKGIGDFIPLYALYALLFADHGLSTAQISSLLAIWSTTAFLLEVPSGAWADTVSRRGLLVLSGILHAAGFATWTIAPSYLGFAIGFVLWGIAGALASGTFEALLYDELTVRGAAKSYARIIGHARAASETAILVSILAATPLYLWGGYQLIGWVSVFFALAHTVVALGLPGAPKTVSVTAVDNLEDEDSGDLSAAAPGEVDAGELEPVPVTGGTLSTPGADGTPEVVRVGEIRLAREVVRKAAGDGSTDGPGAAADSGGRISAPVAGGTLPAADGSTDGVAVRAAEIRVPSEVGRRPAIAVEGNGSAGEIDRSCPETEGLHGAELRPVARYLAMLRGGVGEALRVRVVRNAVLLYAMLFGVTAFDEYFALLAQSVGVATSVVPVLLGATVLGSLVGSTLAGRTAAMSGRTMALAVGGAGVLFVGGALVTGLATRHPGAVYLLAAVGFSGIGISYGIVYNAAIVAESRLQEAIEGPARATVMSVSGLAAEVFALVVFAFAALANALPMSITVALLGAALLPMALVTPTWLPRHRPEPS